MAQNQAYHRDEKIALFSISYLPSMTDVSPSEDAFELMEIRQECLFAKTQNGLCFGRVVLKINSGP